MTYKIDIDPDAQDQIRALPAHLLVALAEVLALLEIAPWSGEPHHAGHPHRPMRQVVFGTSGRGVVTYLILDDQHRVDVLKVQWMG